DWINGLNFRGSRTIAGCTMDRTSIPRIAFSGPRVEPPAGRSGHVPGAVLNPAFAGLDERGFGIEQVQAQALGLQHLVAEFFERREYLSAENDVETDGCEQELDIVGGRHDVNVAAGLLELFHVEDQRADSAAAQECDFVQIEYDMGAAFLHHLGVVAVEDAGTIPSYLPLDDEEGCLRTAGNLEFHRSLPELELPFAGSLDYIPRIWSLQAILKVWRRRVRGCRG